MATIDPKEGSYDATEIAKMQDLEDRLLLVEGGAGATVEAITATADGTTTGTISSTTGHATVTSDDANKIVILPAPVVGKMIVIHEASGVGFELRSSAPATIAINGGTGASAESAIAANSTCVLICVTATAWKGFYLDADSDVAKIEAAA